MTLKELAARDYKKAQISYLRAQQRPNTPEDELAHLRELVELRREMAELCGTDLISRADVLALLQGSDTTGYKPSALRQMVEQLPACGKAGS